MERRGLDGAAADRRRDDQSGSTPPSRSRRSTRGRPSTCSTRRASSASSRPARPRAPRDARRREPRAAGAAARAARRAQRKPLLPIETARANRRLASSSTTRRRRRSSARALVEPSLETLRAYIDWQFFFHAWELKGKFPAILEQPAARASSTTTRRSCSTRSSARGCSRRAASTASGRRSPTATISLSTTTTTTRFRFLRQQADVRRLAAEPVARRLRRARRRPRRRVRGHRRHRRRRAGRPLRGRARRLPRDHGQGARRPPRRGVRRVPARARAARVVRPGRSSRPSELIAEGSAASARRSATRPAPTTREKREALRAARRRGGGHRADGELRDAARRASVSGLYFAHPEARYFSVGRVGRDQVEDYAARKGMPARRGRALAPPNLALRAGGRRPPATARRNPPAARLRWPKAPGGAPFSACGRR